MMLLDASRVTAGFDVLTVLKSSTTRWAEVVELVSSAFPDTCKHV